MPLLSERDRENLARWWERERHESRTWAMVAFSLLAIMFLCLLYWR
jgi:hypothetical protein